MSPQAAVRVLFLSMGNAARSIMAECLLRRLGHGRFITFSAGVQPRGEVHPLALKVLRERFRLDPGGARSKSWEEFRGEHFDLVITVCDKARETWAVWPGRPRMAHWDEPDPVAFEGSEAARELLFLQVARELSVRLDLLCALPLEKLMRL
ncbi:arsenate reductase ArsC [Archangium lansingense]|uniref:Arsenate reductase ArsC n=1 Tax=Archangium lansingense TaxID=2995310 RepID=A0ABT3ZVZ2_9BACT|nr:arsenate reductase ArsC [Archangium lansinium]MCY1073531.1 arsenate reductase ArsC [Archangium lansinium]